MGEPILYFFFWILELFLNLNLDVNYERNKFFETLSKKDFKFVLSKKGGLIAFNLSFVFLLAEVDFVSEKRGRKNKMLRPCNIRLSK